MFADVYPPLQRPRPLSCSAPHNRTDMLSVPCQDHTWRAREGEQTNILVPAQRKKYFFFRRILELTFPNFLSANSMFTEKVAETGTCGLYYKNYDVVFTMFTHQRRHLWVRSKETYLVLYADVITIPLFFNTSHWCCKENLMTLSRVLRKARDLWSSFQWSVIILPSLKLKPG